MAYLYIRDILSEEFYGALVTTLENCDAHIDLSEIPWCRETASTMLSEQKNCTKALQGNPLPSVKSNLVALTLLLKAANKLITSALIQKFSSWILRLLMKSRQTLGQFFFYEGQFRLRHTASHESLKQSL